MGASRHFAAAERVLDATSGRSVGLLADWDSERLALWRAHCTVQATTDSPRQAVSEAVVVLERALSGLDPSRLYDRSRAMIELAEAHAKQAEVERACQLLVKSVTLASDAGHVSHVRRCRRVRQHLAPWQHTPPVKQLDERLALIP